MRVARSCHHEALYCTPIRFYDNRALDTIAHDNGVTDSTKGKLLVQDDVFVISSVFDFDDVSRVGVLNGARYVHVSSYGHDVHRAFMGGDISCPRSSSCVRQVGEVSKLRAADHGHQLYRGDVARFERSQLPNHTVAFDHATRVVTHIIETIGEVV